MNQILMGLIVALGLGGWFLYNQNITHKNENTALTFAVEEQKKTISKLVIVKLSSASIILYSLL